MITPLQKCDITRRNRSTSNVTESDHPVCVVAPCPVTSGMGELQPDGQQSEQLRAAQGRQPAEHQDEVQALP